MKQSTIITSLHILSHNALIKTVQRKTIPYSILITNSILKNKKTHLIITLKELLKNTFFYEYIRKFYSYQQSKFRLKKLTSFYLIDTHVYPNYTPLPCAKYIYKNIIKKQFILSQKVNNVMLLQYKATHKDFQRENIIILDTIAYENIMNDTNSHLKSIFTYNSNDNDDLTEFNMLISKITNAEVKRNKHIYLSSTTLRVDKGVSIIKPMLKVSRNIKANCSNLKSISSSKFRESTSTVESDYKSLKKLVLPKVMNVVSPVKYENCKTISHWKYKSVVVSEDVMGKEKVNKKRESFKLKNDSKKCNENILRTKLFMTIKTQIKQNEYKKSKHCFRRRYQSKNNEKSKVSRNENKNRIFFNIGKIYDNTN